MYFYRETTLYNKIIEGKQYYIKIEGYICISILIRPKCFSKIVEDKAKQRVVPIINNI